MMLGRDAIRQIREALGLPEDTLGFTLRVYAGAFVTVECEYVRADHDPLAAHVGTPGPHDQGESVVVMRSSNANLN